MVAWPTPRRAQWVPEPRSNFFARIAPHIRGRVFAAGYRTQRGDQMWNMEVVNTRTGKVLISDNCANLHGLLDACHQATAAARAAWFYDLRHKEVQ